VFFQDLNLSLVAQSDGTDRICHKLYQKPHNLYQYIPFQSAHKPHIFRNFVLNELKRYKLYCTLESDYLDLIILFNIRLYNRGYPVEILEKAILLVPPRNELLEALDHPSQKTKTKTCTLPIIVIPYACLKPNVNFKELLALPDSLTQTTVYKKVYPNSTIIIGTKNAPNIGQYITRSKFSST
jgi:hypothetical protein